jgi:hypothetical protein
MQGDRWRNVPDPLPIPDGLVHLQRRRIAAETAVAAYITEMEARRREEYPAPEQSLERGTWSADESAELARLRTARDRLGREVRQHPVMVQAREEGTFWPTWDALQGAVRQQAE